MFLHIKGIQQVVSKNINDKQKQASPIYEKAKTC